MTTIHFILCLTLGCFTPIDFNPFRNFTPDTHEAQKSHPVATECATSDTACIDRHDDIVLNAALLTTERLLCANSSRARMCYDAYDMIFGNVQGVTPIDPCSVVVRVQGRVTTLFSLERRTTRRAVTQAGWTPGAFAGKCDVAKLQALEGRK